MRSYIDEINGFWRLQERNSLSTGQIALWFALMHINNQYSWQKWFPVASSKLVFLTDLSRTGVYKARNVLKQKGYIDYRESTKSTRPAQYTMLSLAKTCVQVGVQDGVQDGVQVGVQVGVQASSYKTKTKTKKVDTNVSTKESCAFSDFAGDDMELLTALAEFEQMRKAIKKPLTAHAKALTVKKLQALSADRQDWIAILNRSTLNCWQGIFPLPADEKGKKGVIDRAQHDNGDHGQKAGRDWGLKYDA